MMLRNFLAISALVAILLGFGFLGGYFSQRIVASNHNARANSAIWHAVICDIERSVIASPKNDYPRLTPERKIRFLKQYDTLLAKDAHAKACNLWQPLQARLDTAKSRR
jgi:hypothetical protein